MEGIGWKKRYFQANEIIFHGGEPSKSLFFIEEGALRVTVQVELEKSKNMHPGICDMDAGEIFGETCFLESGMRNASVTAITDGYAVEIDAEKELLAQRVVRESLSVRALEKIVERLKKPTKKPRAEKSDLPIDYVRHLSEKLHQHFGTAVHITSTKTLSNGKKVKGAIQIDYYNNEDLTRVLEILGISSDDL